MVTILYIEDNYLNMRLMEKILRSMSLKMIWASEGHTGIEMALTQKPDLVLMDMNLPDMDGLTVTRFLRQQSEISSVPIVAVTANAMHGDRERCIGAGCNDYLAKPLARQEVLNVIHRCLPNASVLPRSG